jgi:uracil-DNA glycosylase
MTIESSWAKALGNRLKSDKMVRLFRSVEEVYEHNQKTVFPSRENLFKAFELCPFTNVKVVIIGQDPYPTRGHAHGLSFSVDSSVINLPRSLRNIFKELCADVHCEMPIQGDLSHWAKQGVLLINTVLTVEEGLPGSHAYLGWHHFTDPVIEVINQNHQSVVFMLWGNKAKMVGDKIDASKHLVLHAPHPSPLSAYQGFFGCKHFSKANQFLVKQGKAPIQW